MNSHDLEHGPAITTSGRREINDFISLFGGLTMSGDAFSSRALAGDATAFPPGISLLSGKLTWQTAKNGAVPLWVKGIGGKPVEFKYEHEWTQGLEPHRAVVTAQKGVGTAKVKLSPFPSASIRSTDDRGWIDQVNYYRMKLDASLCTVDLTFEAGGAYTFTSIPNTNVYNLPISLIGGGKIDLNALDVSLVVEKQPYNILGPFPDRWQKDKVLAEAKAGLTGQIIPSGGFGVAGQKINGVWSDYMYCQGVSFTLRADAYAKIKIPAFIWRSSTEFKLFQSWSQTWKFNVLEPSPSPVQGVDFQAAWMKLN
jgi:hypothetical protein